MIPSFHAHRPLSKASRRQTDRTVRQQPDRPIRLRPFIISTVLVVVATSSIGCGGQTALLERQGIELDSIYAVNRELRTELRSLRDSLRFYDDIHSGQYYRDRRLLVQQIDRLEYDLSICRDGGRTIETLLADELFEPASAELTTSGAQRLASLAESLEAASDSSMIRVEGHSDSTPIGQSLADTYPSNWELSTARASAVVRHLIEEHGLNEGRLEVAGFGSTRPIAPNSTAEGRRSNRRIRIALMSDDGS